MHIVPHSRNAWVEKAKHRHDAWHLDLIGKFRVPSLGGNSYVLTIIDNYSRYCTAVPIKDKRAAMHSPASIQEMHCRAAGKA